MDKNNFLRCDACKIDFNNAKERNRHSKSKEHSKVMQAQYENSTVFVAGLPSGVPDDVLGNYFFQYGPVKKLRIVNKQEKSEGAFAFVTFEDIKTVEKVLVAVHHLGENQLKVSKKINIHEQTNRIPEKSKEDIHKELCYELKSSNSVSDSMEILCKDMQLTEKDFTVREELKQKIINILRPYYPQCEVHIYGSTMNGAGMKKSDVDILFLPTSEYCNVDVPKDEFRTVPSLNDFKAGKVPDSYLNHLDNCSQLGFVNQVFRTYRSMFLRPYLIPAKCPIINFVSELRGVRMHCDLSCSNKLVIFNTQLMKLFVDMDKRVKPLLLTLRYWAKYHTFIKKGILSSYAFSLLVIFYLQSVQPPVLPTVEQLLNKGRFSRIVAGWECGFSGNLDILKPSANTQSTEELLLGFFKYVLEFDFFANILCMSTGKIMSVKEFQMLDDPKLKDFNVSIMMIQDPFELSRNVSSTLKQCTLIAMKMQINTLLESYKKKPGPKNLSPLFEPFTCQLTEKKKTEGGSMACTIDFDSSHYFNLAEIFSKPDELKTAWFDQATQAVFDVLQDGLLINCEILDKKMTPATVCEVTDYFDSETELLVSIQCSVYNCTWNGRNTVTQSVSTVNKSALQVEREISQSVIEKNPQQKYKEAKLWFMCECFRYTKLNILDILVLFTPLTPSKEFVTISVFLKSHLTKTVSKVLKEQKSSIKL